MFSGLPCETQIAHIARIARTRGTVRVRLGACRAWHSLLGTPPARRRSPRPRHLPGIEASCRARAKVGILPPRSGFRLRSTPRSVFRLRYFARKTHHRRRPRSIADIVFFHHSHAQPSILGWAQDCSCQSCCCNRIASTIPVLTAGLPRCTTSSSGLELFLPKHRLVVESAPL